jgi:hypothetical protein
MISSTRPIKNQRNMEKNKGLLGWEDMGVWRDSRPPYISEGILDAYIQHVIYKCFLWRSQSGAKNRIKKIHGSLPYILMDPFRSYLKKKTIVLYENI